MKRIALIAAFFILTVALTTGGPREDYVSRYAKTAVGEMYRTGVPASITLAQGLLESGSGTSSLATGGNNHFGIKCHRNWKGKTQRADDDAPKECFRVYDSAEESFRDHSDFLRYSDRYKFLFELETTDYKSWAYGLKKAGYATDPSYPSKLIKYIEDLELWKYDRMRPEDMEAGASSVPSIGEKPSASAKDGPDESRKKASDSKKKASDSKKKSPDSKKKAAEDSGKAGQEIPSSPLSLEAPQKMEAAVAEHLSFPLNRPVYTLNGVPFVYSIAGETYSSIASSYNLFPKEILRFNDLRASRDLLPGTVVFLQAKKKSSARGLDKYIVQTDGESLRDICQRFGVRMSSILKKNAMPADVRLLEGDEIILRK